MARQSAFLAVLAALALSGCAASIAAGAIGAAARGAGGDPNAYYDDPALKLAAGQACRAQAARYGEVHVIDLEQRGARKVIVYGTTTGTAGRQSFQCTYAGRITNFRLRPL